LAHKLPNPTYMSETIWAYNISGTAHPCRCEIRSCMLSCP